MRLKSFLCAVVVLSSLGPVHEAFAVVNCAEEITSNVGASRSGYRLNRRLNLFVQTVTITNTTGTPIQGPLALTLVNLSANVSLFNGAGASPCSGPSGPYIEIGTGADNVLSPGERASIVLNFENPSRQRISYDIRLFTSMAQVNPIQSVSITPDVVFLGTSTPVTVRALVPYQQSAIPTVTLVRVDAAGNVLGTEGVLVDNGNLAQGDEIQGDGLFSMIKTYSPTQTEDYRLRIRMVVNTSENLSAQFLLRFLEALTNAQLTDIVNTQQTLQQLYTSTPGDKNAKLQAVLDALAQDPDIIQFGTSESSNGVWMLHEPGILGGLLLNPDGTRGAVPMGDQLRALPLPPSQAVSPPLIPPVEMGSRPVPLRESAASLVDPNEVGNTNVLIASPFLFQFGATDEGAGLNTLYTSSTCPKYNVTYLTNTAFTVDVVKTMSNYGVIHVATHGDTYYNGILSLWTDKFGWSVPGSQVVFLTGQTATVANKVTYNVDLAAGRLAIVSGYYGILPSFISTYGGAYPNSLVFIGACRSTFNTTMQNAFLGKGAGTYLGFSEYVASSFAFGRANYFHNAFVQDPNNLVTTGDIFIPGQSDGSSPPAFWNMGGSTTLQLPTGSELQNGGFETGTLGAWAANGDGRVVPQLGGFFYPTEGNFAGIISTGLGFTTSSGSISQNVCLPTDSKTLTFDWNFTSEEFQEWCASIYQDFFSVQVVTSSGTVTLFNRIVDNLCGGTFPVPFSFDQGDTHSYGWQSATIDISAIATAAAGAPVRLIFSAGDVGDSIYDTAILIDKVQIKK
jgi:hypothetical protein